MGSNYKTHSRLAQAHQFDTSSELQNPFKHEWDRITVISKRKRFDLCFKLKHEWDRITEPIQD
jgi:hypothetical protein